MVTPATAVVWAETMDPSDIIDYQIDTSTLIDSTDSLSSYTLVPYSESQLLGLSVDRSSVANGIITCWLLIAQANQQDASFVAGATLPIQLTISTSQGRTKQRTVCVKVIQR